jgi:DNA-binding NarL/FixJ family response regulator
MAAESQYRVLLVDDHEIVRRGLKTVLQERSDITIVGESGTMKSGIEETVRL